MITIQLAIKNVYRKRERSFLTMIGVLLAVGSFISLLSIAEGMYSRVEREINGRYVDIYILPSDAAALPTGPIGTVGFSNEVLPADLPQKLKNYNEIRDVAPVYRLQQKINTDTVIIWGIDYDKIPAFFPYLRLQQGSRMFADNVQEMVVGGAIMGKLPSSVVVLDGQPFDRVGVCFPNDSFQDYFCFISLDNAMKLKNAKGYHEIWVQLDSHKNSRVFRQRMAEELRKQNPNLNIKTREEYQGATNEYIKYVWILQFAISAIGVLIAMTAAMNTMLMSTYERIKEFGTLRSLGASRFNVFTMILTESLILSFVGGIGGIVLGVMGSRVLDEAVKALLQLSFPLAKVTPFLILDALILSFVVGLVGAIIPAIIVYRMNIIDALRWE